MARMLSIIASTIRGSTGGLTYLSNPYHQIVVRARTAPTQPNTEYQSKIRAAMTTAATAWHNLAKITQTGWENYAKTCTFEGPLGNYQITGRSMFIGNISAALYAYVRGWVAFAPAYDAPTLPGFGGLTILTTEAPDAGIGFKVNVRNPNADLFIIVAGRSIAFDSNRNRFKGPWVSDAQTATGPPGGGDGAFQWQNLSASNIYFWTCKGFTQTAPIRMTERFYGRATATAAP